MCLLTIRSDMFMRYRRVLQLILTGLAIMFLTGVIGTNSFALTSDEIVVVVNTRMSGSVNLARYYMKVRNIAEENLLKTSLVLTETMIRSEYEENLLTPLKKKITALERLGKHIYGVVLIYGVPLKVLQPELSWDEEETVASLKESKRNLQIGNSSDDDRENVSKKISEKIKEMSGVNKRAAVDSELALARVDTYSLDGWIPNPYFLGFQKLDHTFTKDDVLLVSRLDGPDLETVYRMVDDSLWVEKQGGLRGVAYFDARWKFSDKKSSGYALYDSSLHKAASIVKKRLPVVVNDKEELFQPGDAPDAALYAGWYSLAKYIDAFQWNRGL